MCKLINLLGLVDHEDGLTQAITFQRLARCKPRWLKTYEGRDDPMVAININQPVDAIYDLNHLLTDECENSAYNTALFYVWLDGIYPQEHI